MQDEVDKELIDELNSYVDRLESVFFHDSVSIDMQLVYLG